MSETIALTAGAGCCPAGMPGAATRRVDPTFVSSIEQGRDHIDLLVPGMHCAACIATIERTLNAIDGVGIARANFTSRRVGVDFDPAIVDPDRLLGAVEALGYEARPFDAAALRIAGDDAAERELMRAMAVAGFAAANVMLMSVSVWSGAEAATRDLFHWLSAMVALPAIAYAGRPFFRSALRALAAGRLNMDVPISLGVLLASVMSLYETAVGGGHAYFDASISLLFFLLVGRFLDHTMRGIARQAAARLLSLAARSAMRIGRDGSVAHVPIADIVPGDHVRITAGERVPVDGVVEDGESDIDRSMLNGEPEPQRVSSGTAVFAGTMNLTGPLTVSVTAPSEGTLLAEIARLMEAAQQGRGRYVRIAERVSRLYAPVVHLAALATFAAWMAAGAGWHAAATAAVAVLIITCPCALGLAVPAVQAVASGRLLQQGIMLKEGSALERLAMVDTVVFDKTGTLTLGTPRLTAAPPDARARDWAIAAALGRASRHPLARALADASPVAPAANMTDIVEVAGSGMRGRAGDDAVLLGRRDWVGGGAWGGGTGSEIWLRVGRGNPIRFAFEDTLRPDAAETVGALKAAGMRVVLLSGDRPEAVGVVARAVGIADWRAACLPADKVRILGGLATGDCKVLMVGDGMNDAPALAAASVSISPANGSDVSQAAADIVFTSSHLSPVTAAIDVARSARRLIIENIALAILYNALAVPLAMAGLVTPLIAAIAMSSSSVIVTANALRLRLVPLLPAREVGPGVEIGQTA